MQCLSFCVSQGINLIGLERTMKSKGYHCARYFDVLQVIDKTKDATIFYFNNGTIVTWNVKKARVRECLEVARPFYVEPLKKIHEDGFIYVIGNKVCIKPHDYFNVEIMQIDEDDPELKLGLSYAFSNSIKLRLYEHKIERLVEEYSPMVSRIAKTGKPGLKRKEILTIIAKILEAKGLVNLKVSYTYQPKYFWQHPNLETDYLMLESYLDIGQRVDSINRQIDTLNEIYNMLNSYLENKHSHFLEVVIIVLIFAEIIFSVLNLHL